MAETIVADVGFTAFLTNRIIHYYTQVVHKALDNGAI